MEMATRTRRTRAESDFGPVPATDTPEGRKEFKERASRVLHAAGDAKGLCAAFDQILADVGLLPRQSVIDSTIEDARYRVNRYSNNNYGITVDVKLPELVGEDTQDAFDEWFRAAATRLHDEAKRHDISKDYNKVLAEAGFPAQTERKLVVEGTFKVPVTAWVLDGEDGVTGVKREDLANQVHNALYYEEGSIGRPEGVEVNWKATVAESD